MRGVDSVEAGEVRLRRWHQRDEPSHQLEEIVVGVVHLVLLPNRPMKLKLGRVSAGCAFARAREARPTSASQGVDPAPEHADAIFSANSMKAASKLMT